MSPHAFHSHTSRRWTVLLARALGVALASAAALAFLAGKISRTAHDIGEARNTLAAFHAKYELLDRLQADHAKTAPHLAKLEGAIPPVESFPLIQSYIASVATKTSNTAAARFDPVPAFNEQSLGELSFSLEANGSLATIENLLKELEVAPYFINVRAVSISLPTGAQGQAQADLSGVVYLKDSSI